jgi:hypothetical protein
MADSFFEKLQLQAFRAGVQPRSDESQKWFRNKLKNIGQVNRQKLLRDSALQRVARPRMGDMYMFFYDPKHKETLPYYDTFPLIIMVEKAPGGFYGLNMHYLPPVLRAKLFDGLAKSDERYDENTRFRARYRLLQSVRKLKYFKPCFKHYLTKHVEGRISKVEAPEWEIALFMPTQRFKKATATQVYADSRKAYR